MNPVFLENYTSNILKNLSKNKFIVKVPEIAIQTEAQLEEHSNRKYFVNDIEIPDKKKDIYLPEMYSEDTEFKYSLSTPSVDFSNGEIPLPNLALTQVYLPVTEIIDIFNAGMSIQIVGKDKLVELIKLLSYTIEDLKIAVDITNATEVLEQVEAFLETIVDNKRGTITEEFNKPSRVIAAGLGGSMSSTLIDDRKNASPYMDLTDIVIK